MTIANPYFTSVIVKDPVMFFGRDENLTSIRDRLRKGDSIAVVGLRRIGKSSLLYQLAYQADALPNGVVAVYLDLQDAAHNHPSGLLTAALRELDEKLNNRYNFSPVESLADFSTGVKRIAADGFQPVLCLDEVEKLTDCADFDDDFFEGLRSLGSQRVLAFVTASAEYLDVLLQRQNRTSPFYNIFTNLDLRGLSNEAARALLTRPFLRVGTYPPPDDHVDYVLELAGHYPFYLQMAAYHLFELRRDSGVLNRLVLRQAFADHAEPHFQYLWHHLSPDEQAGVKRLAGVPTVVQNWERTRGALVRRGLAEGDAGSSRLFSDVFSKMVRTGGIRDERVPLPLLPSPPESLSPGKILYAYTLVALASAGTAFLIARLTPYKNFWPFFITFFVTLTVVLTFILVLTNKIRGEQFVEWLSKLWEGLSRLLEERE